MNQHATMKNTTLACVLLLPLALAACQGDSFGHRSQECDPDKRLAELLHQYDACKHGRVEGDGGDQVLVDCDRVWTQIERLSLDFPRHAPSVMANAVIAYDEHQIDKADRYVNMVFSIQPVHAEAAILKSRIAIETGNLPAARRLLENQVRCTPDHAGLREALSAVLYMSGDVQGAAAALDVAEGLGAPPWRIAFNRGLIAEKSGDSRAAEDQYEAAVAGNPEFQPAQARLAGIRAMSGYNKPASPSAMEGGK
jgi:tetratricopeptide (TPR) repeat protein